MRRGSLFAPLLLIAIGALFLARNFYPDIPLVEYFARYWPVLLMVWGVLRLGEILFWAANRQPLPSRGISGGEWTLAIALILFGSTLHAVLGFSSWFPRGRIELGGLDMFGESYDYPLSAEKAAGKTPHILIESFRGSARITGADTEEVKVTGRKTIRSMDQSGADQADKDTPFELAGNAGDIVIHTNQDRARISQRVSDELEISVPRGASIEAHGRSGDFDVDGVNGSVDITSDSAGVRLQDIGGDARLDLRRSDIVRAVNLKGALDLKGSGADIDLENIGGQITINGSYTGNVQFENLAKSLHFVGPQTEVNVEKLPGQIHMPLGNFNASNVVGPLRLKTMSRDVQIDNFTNPVDVFVQRGDIELRPGSPLAKIDAQTQFGNLILELPAGAKFDLDAATTRGQIINSYGGGMTAEETRSGQTLRSSNGGPPLHLRTDLGEITVRQASPNAPPLEPPNRTGPFGRGPKQLKQFRPRRPLKSVEQ